MSEPYYFETPQGRRLAYHYSAGQGPCVVFLGGLRSDMEGSKALHLETWCRKHGQAFLRFDYSGHGQSSGRFEEGCIGDWAEDTSAILQALTSGPLILIGSSMGGWQALLFAKAHPERLAGLIGIAAAPDFTEEGYWANFTPEQKHAIEHDGSIELPSDYGDPYIITKRLIEDGRQHLVGSAPLNLPFPVRLLQGSADSIVPTQVALKLLEHAQSPDLELVIRKDGDHSLSDPAGLACLINALEGILVRQS